jgi:hypothetical protein
MRRRGDAEVFFPPMHRHGRARPAHPSDALRASKTLCSQTLAMDGRIKSAHDGLGKRWKGSGSGRASFPPPSLRGRWIAMRSIARRRGTRSAATRSLKPEPSVGPLHRCAVPLPRNNGGGKERVHSASSAAPRDNYHLSSRKLAQRDYPGPIPTLCDGCRLSLRSAGITILPGFVLRRAKRVNRKRGARDQRRD